MKVVIFKYQNERRLHNMKIEIGLELNQCELNLDYRRLFLSFIKSLLESEKEDVYEYYYDKNFNRAKNFTFWVKMMKPEFTDNCIKLQSNMVTLCISSSDIRFLTYIFNAAIKRKNTSYPIVNNGRMIVKKVKSFNTKTIKEEEIIVSMTSPLFSRFHEAGKKDMYYLYNEERFEENIKNNVIRKYGNIGNSFFIEPVKGKKVIIKSFGTKIPSSLGIYKLKGDVNLLNELYLNGLSSKNGAGFGKFEIIG